MTFKVQKKSDETGKYFDVYNVKGEDKIEFLIIIDEKGWFWVNAQDFIPFKPNKIIDSNNKKKVKEKMIRMK